MRRLLARAFPGKVREGQALMTEGVQACLASREHGAFDAPCGTGKSGAYLLPAIASGQRVVVATATIALQGQVLRDIPRLAQAIGIPTTFALVKGKTHFLCPLRVASETAQKAPSWLSIDEQKQWACGLDGRGRPGPYLRKYADADRPHGDAQREVLSAGHIEHRPPSRRRLPRQSAAGQKHERSDLRAWEHEPP